MSESPWELLNHTSTQASPQRFRFNWSRVGSSTRVFVVAVVVIFPGASNLSPGLRATDFGELLILVKLNPFPPKYLKRQIVNQGVRFDMASEKFPISKM